MLQRLDRFGCFGLQYQIHFIQLLQKPYCFYAFLFSNRNYMSPCSHAMNAPRLSFRFVSLQDHMMLGSQLIVTQLNLPPTLANMLTSILFSRCMHKYLARHAAGIHLGLTRAFAFAYLTEISRTSPIKAWLLNLRNLSPC